MKERGTSKKLWFAVGGISITGLLLGGCQLTRAGYESAAFQVVRTQDRVELRDYPELSLVTTAMARDADGNDGSFMRLFGYISGKNDRSEKISMTTPVFMEEGATEDRMSFVIPSEIARKGPPSATMDCVRVIKQAAGRYAVYRLKGARTKAKTEAAKKAILTWLSDEKMTPQGDFIVAGYDPPFTPGALQRNEVMVRVTE